MMARTKTRTAAWCAALVAAATAATGGALVLEELEVAAATRLGERRSGGVPLVFAHGMGDSCFNPGMKQITELAGKRAGAYSTCIGDGDSQAQDTVDGFFLNMNKQVEFFAAKVRADPKLKDGFDAVGLSQGNLVIRGYIEVHNDPPVRRFLSIHGPLAGVGSLPQCNPDGLAGVLCRKMTELVGDVAYSAAIQELVAQSNYLKDPTELDAYLAHNIFLPRLNNEVAHAAAAKYKKNFASLDALVLVKALGDTMIFPKESEWFGFFAPGQFAEILPMNATQAFASDAFGLRTLQAAGKIHFETSEGNHLQFALQDLYKWIDTYLTER